MRQYNRIISFSSIEDRLEHIYSQKSLIVVSVTNDQFVLLQVPGNSSVRVGGKVNCRDRGTNSNK